MHDFVLHTQVKTNNKSLSSDMLQVNKRYGTKKLVRRRPIFVSAADADTIRTK